MSAVPHDPQNSHDTRDDDTPPLAELSAAWRALESPDATAPLDEPDAATRATVEWLRAAWQASAPPVSPRLPWRLSLRTSLRRTPWLATTLAAAATFLLALRLLAPAPQHPPIAAPTEQIAAAAPAPASAPAPAPAPDPAPIVLADRVLLRSGNVRVILFTPSAAPTARGPTPESPR